MSENTPGQSGLYADHRRFLEEMAETYDLPDADKVLRVLVTYAMQEGNRDEIFKTIRCRHCG